MRDYNYRRKMKWKEQKRRAEVYSHGYPWRGQKKSGYKGNYFLEPIPVGYMKFTKNYNNRKIRRVGNKDMFSNGSRYKRANEYWFLYW